MKRILKSVVLLYLAVSESLICHLSLPDKMPTQTRLETHSVNVSPYKNFIQSTAELVEVQLVYNGERMGILNTCYQLMGF